MFVVSALSELLKQNQMEDMIVLYYKFQRNLDDTFNTRAIAFIKANLDKEELGKSKFAEVELKSPQE